jgi:hypothetical protein
MKRIIWAVVATLVCAALLAGLAGKDDIRRFLRMRRM